MRFAAAVFVLAQAAAAPAPDPALKTFIAAFGDALRHGALDAAAGMTHFPLQNAAYQQPDAIPRAKFKRQFQVYKGDGFADCLKKTPPLRADKTNLRLGDWRVECNGNIFYFKSFDGQWRHSGYENINE